MQLCSKLFFVTWRGLKVNVEDDVSFCHGFP